jgi:hypothetical protein
LRDETIFFATILLLDVQFPLLFLGFTFVMLKIVGSYGCEIVVRETDHARDT